MPLTRITVRIRGNVIVIDPSSRMCLCDDEDGLPPLMARLLEQGHLKFLLNLHRVHYIDSTAIVGIVQGYNMVARRGGKLKMCNVVQRIRDLLDVTKLTPILEVFDSEEAGLRSFEGTVSTRA